MAQHNYYDSNQMMKELLFRNPGFEGQVFQSVVRLGPGATASSVIEDQPFTQWPSGFWNGATYEIIGSQGTAQGRTGTITASLAPNRANPPSDPNGSAQGTTYVFSDSDPNRIAAADDYMILRRVDRGGSGGGAAFSSWGVSASGGGVVTTESADLPVGTTGQQCVRLTADQAGQQAGVSGMFDTMTGFLRLNGQFRLAFKAKGVGGANRLYVSVRRGSTPYLSQTVQLTTDWADYTYSFPVSEDVAVSGALGVNLSATAQSDALVDDVSLRQTDSSASNPTEYRDDVVNAIAGLNPGVIRYQNWQDLGDSLDNVLATPFARMRSGYGAYVTSENNMMAGLHEHLVLCEHIGADPWYPVPVTFSAQEAANLMEYLGGPTNTPYGYLRAQRGHPTPWTSVFNRILLEFGNENWNNSAYRGGAITRSESCGQRASEIFTVIKASPYYSAAQVQCILGGQSGNWGYNLTMHNHSSQHDVVTLAPYMSPRVDSFETNGLIDIEKLFGPLFAGVEWWSTVPGPTTGLMAYNRDNIQASSRPVPLSVYEVNLHTTQGSISQAALDGYVPSVGAAIAIAGHMLEMVKEIGCTDQVFFSLAGYEYAFTASDNTSRIARLWGATIDMGKTNRKRPQYYAQRMVNDALAGDLVRATQTGANPTWSVANENGITYTDAHHLQSFAFSNGASRSMVIFNFHRTSALGVNFSGANAPTGTVTMQRLTSANITDNNETADVVATTTQTLNGFDPTQALSLPPFSMTVLQWTP